jgi:hypothetical protein
MAMERLDPFDDGQRLRERLQRYEFPFDEKAWQAMQVLLAQSTARSASLNSLRPHYGQLLLVCVAMLFLSDHSKLSRAGGVPSVPQEAVAFNAPPAPEPSRKHLPSEKVDESAPDGAYVVTGRRAGLYRRTARPISLQSMAEQVTSAASTQPEPSAEPPARRREAIEETEEKHTAFLEMTSLPPRLWSDLALGDTLSLPASPPPAARSPLEWGWTVGLGAGLMAWRPFHLSPTVLMGGLLRYRMGNRAALQGEFLLKTGSEYRRTFAVESNTLSGPIVTERELRNLIFAEAAVGLHYRYCADQSFFAGIRPSWNIPLHKRSFALFSTFVTASDYDLRSFIRGFDLGITIGWEWRLHPKWAVAARLTQGSGSLIKDPYTKTGPLYNSDLQVALRYYVRPDERVLLKRLQREAAATYN